MPVAAATPPAIAAAAATVLMLLSSWEFDDEGGAVCDEAFSICSQLQQGQMEQKLSNNSFCVVVLPSLHKSSWAVFKRLLFLF